MKTKRRSLSFLTALMLVFSMFALVPEGAFRAQALLGSGTKSDPYVVATYDELRERFSAVGEKWIKLGSDIVSKDHNNLYNLSVSNTVHLDLAGHKIERKSGMTYDKELIYVGTGSTLIIDDSGTGGKIIADMPHSFYSCITVYGTLTVNGGTFSTADNYNLYDSTDCVYKQYVDVINTNDANAEVTVYDGTVDGKLTLRKGSVKIYGGKISELWYSFADSSAKMMIYAGKFNRIDYLQQKGASRYLANFIYQYSHFYSRSTEISAEKLASVKVWKADDYDYHVNITCNFATDMSLEVTEPKNGKNPETPKTAWSRGLIAYDFTWNDYQTGETLSSSDTFVGGHKYSLAFLIKPKDGYVIAKDPVINFWGLSRTASVGKISDKVYVARADFDCPALIPISKVSILTTKGLPKAGDSPAQLVTATVGTKIKSWNWLDSYENELTESSKFEAGKTYTLRLLIQLEEGYKWASSVTATVNGNSMKTTPRLGNYICTYSYTVPKQTVSSANFQFRSFADPKPGDYPSNVYTTTEGVKIVSYDWFDPATLKTIDRSKPFEAGKSYMLSIRITAQDGYTLSKTLTAKINGKSMKVITDDSEPGAVWLQITYNLPTDGLKGDVDGNGVINMKDLATLQRYVNGWDVTINEANSDLDNSGSINMKDVAALQRLINSL